MMARKRISILGATGSVGTSTLDLVLRSPDAFEVVALSAHRDVAGLAKAVRDTGAQFAAIADPSCYGDLKQALSGVPVEVAAGPEAVIEAGARSADWVMAAIVGAAGLKPTLAAVGQGAAVAFANKECLVCAGTILMAVARKAGATLLPVDSEHNAIFQVFEERERERIDKLILTASGGPFRTWRREDMAKVSPAQAVAHPNWSMGAKISVDSATMMNKGLELIEAAHLFAMPEDRIEILVHPQSVVHSLVSYADGSMLAQLGSPDMRIPIAHALAWPRRMATPAPRLDLAKIGTLTFEQPDPDRFPALSLARACLKAGAGHTNLMNAANEEAVAAFLDGRIGFLDITEIVRAVVEDGTPGNVETLEDVLAIDALGRDRAQSMIASLAAA